MQGHKLGAAVGIAVLGLAATGCAAPSSAMMTTASTGWRCPTGAPPPLAFPSYPGAGRIPEPMPATRVVLCRYAAGTGHGLLGPEMLHGTATINNPTTVAAIRGMVNAALPIPAASPIHTPMTPGEPTNRSSVNDQGIHVIAVFFDSAGRQFNVDIQLGDGRAPISNGSTSQWWYPPWNLVNTIANALPSGPADIVGQTLLPGATAFPTNLPTLTPGAGTFTITQTTG